MIILMFILMLQYIDAYLMLYFDIFSIQNCTIGSFNDIII